MAAELTAKLAVCSILERGFDDILVCEWIQNGVKNTKKRRFFNVVLTTSLYMNGFKPVSELTVRLTVGPTGFHDILVCEWIQTGVKNTKNRRVLNVLLTTSLNMNGFKQGPKPDPGHRATYPTYLPTLGWGLGARGWGLGLV